MRGQNARPRLTASRRYGKVWVSSHHSAALISCPYARHLPGSRFKCFRLDLGSLPAATAMASTGRSFLQPRHVAGMATSSEMPELLRQGRVRRTLTKNTSVIPDLARWRTGSHGHAYDMKPRTRRSSTAACWRPIRTKKCRASGHHAKCSRSSAQVTDKFSVVRSLHHDTGDHFSGGHRMLTTKDMGVSGLNNPQRFPGIGAIVHRELGSHCAQAIPGFYTATPHAASIGLAPGYFGGHMLGQCNTTGHVRDRRDPTLGLSLLGALQPGISAAGLTMEKLDDRKSLLAALRQQADAPGRLHPRRRKRWDGFPRRAFLEVRHRTDRAAGVRHEQGTDARARQPTGAGGLGLVHAPRAAPGWKPAPRS